MSFGKKGLAQGTARPATPAQAMARPAMRVPQPEGDPLTAKREAFIAAERARVASEGSPSRPGLSDTAANYRTPRSHSVDQPRWTLRVFGPVESRNLFVAYIWWFVLSNVSAHRFYAGAIQSGVMQVGLLLTSVAMVFVVVPLGAAGILAWIGWVFLDAFLLPGMMRRLKSTRHVDASIFA